jgi:hypothetical protein
MLILPIDEAAAIGGYMCRPRLGTR